MLDAIAGRKSPLAAGHDDLRRRILDEHPEIRRLYGPDVRTALAAPLILAVHWATAWAVSGTNALVVFLTAFFFGQLVMRSAAALVHETAHRLVFAERRLKRLFDVLLEAILAVGRQLTYQHEHISSHHPHLGDYERDYEHEDVCRFLARRSFGGKHPRARRALTILELGVNHVWALSIFLGKCGITNLGQSLSEHPHGDAAVPTRSTYWWGNRLLFNTGYHHEHHTFPGVAWTRLPSLKAIAPREFDVASDRSYLEHWWDHVRSDFGPSRRNPFLARENADRCA